MPPSVAGQLAHSGGVFVAGTLPEFLSRLGVALPPAVGAAMPLPDLRTSIDAWTGGPAVGPWACAALCQRLLAEMGAENSATALNTMLEAALAAALLKEQFDPNMGAVARQLATSSLSARDAQRGLAWSAQELAFHEAMLNTLSQKGARKVRTEVRLEYLRNTAGVYNNVGLAHTLREKAPDAAEAARKAFLEAQTRARAAGDLEFQAVLHLNLGRHAQLDPDEQLRAFRAAQAAARATGSGRVLIEALSVEAELLAVLSELDLATEVAAQMVSLLPVAGTTGHAWQHALLRAELAARRGRVGHALEICEAALGSHPPESALGGRVAARLRRMLGFDAAARPRLKALLSALRDPGGDFGERPVFLPEAPPAKGEAALRHALAQAEFAQQHGALPRLLELLCELQHGRGAPDRLVDAAGAMRAAAERVDDVGSLVVAEQYSGIGHDLLGNLVPAAAAFRAAIAAATRAGRHTGHLWANLGGVVWQQGDGEEAERLFAKGRAELLAAADWDQYLVATVNLGRWLVRTERRGEAVALLHTAAATPGLPADNPRVRDLPRLAAFWESGQTEVPRQHGAPTEVEIGPPPSAEALLAMRARAGSAAELGNLALIELAAGEEDAALRHIEEARQLYKSDGDLAGQSRCWNNLAQVHAAHNRWDEAITATRNALKLREAALDREGRILTLSNLAGFLLHAGRAGEAVETARSCLHLAPSGLRSWPLAWAYAVVALGSLRGRHWGDAQAAIPLALQLLYAVEHPERDGLVAHLKESAALLAKTAGDRASASARRRPYCGDSNARRGTNSEPPGTGDGTATGILKAQPFRRRPCDVAW